MSFPTMSVEVAFTTDPMDTPTWTDVTAYVRSLSMVTGKQQQLDAYAPGVLTVEFDNSGRRFDPLHASGPYYGNLLPNKRIRVRATWNGTTYDVFYGFVDGWPQSYAPPASSTVRVTATDAFKILAKVEDIETPWEAAVLADTPRAWWRMDETKGRVAADSSGNGRDGIYPSGSAADFTAAGLLPIPGSSQSTPPGEVTYGVGAVHAPRAAALTGTAWTIEAWVRCTRGAGFIIGQSFTIEDGAFAEIYVDVSRSNTLGTTELDEVTVAVPCSGSNGFRLIHFRNTGVGDGRVHHVVATRNGSGAAAVACWVDGIKRTITETFGDAPALIVDASPGELEVAASALSSAGKSEVVVDEVAIYDSVLTNARIAAHYAAGAAPWDGDQTGTRVGRLLDAAGWPAADRNIDTGISKLGPADLSDQASVLARIQLLETTEQGAFFVDHRDGGKLRFRDRHKVLTETVHTTSQATFSDDAAETLHYRGDSLVLTYDETLVLNRFHVDWVGGTVTVDDTTSQDTYGVRAQTVTTLINSRQEAESLGAWLLDRYAAVFPRVESFTIEPSATNGTTRTAMFAESLGRKIGDRITVEITPQGVGSAISQEVLIEGITHDVSDVEWRTTFWCSPAEIDTRWTLGVDQLDYGPGLAH